MGTLHEGDDVLWFYLGVDDLLSFGFAFTNFSSKSFFLFFFFCQEFFYDFAYTLFPIISFLNLDFEKVAVVLLIRSSCSNMSIKGRDSIQVAVMYFSPFPWEETCVD